MTPVGISQQRRAHVSTAMAQNTTQYKQFLSDFINIYRNETCLWQIKSKFYNNRKKRNAALDKLVAKYKEVELNANREMVKKKINSLRTNYMKEKRKVDNSKRPGAEDDDVYEPKLWYFKEFMFLNDQSEPNVAHCDIHDEKHDENFDKEHDEEYHEEHDTVEVLDAQNTSQYKQFLSDFINIYRNETCLWQIKSKFYNNRKKRDAALDKLVAKYKEVEINANREMVKKKINSLRTNYMKEKRKVDNSRRPGAEDDDIYEPKLWYFKKFIFLNDQTEPKDAHSDINDEKRDEELDEELYEKHDEKHNEKHDEKHNEKHDEKHNEKHDEKHNEEHDAVEVLEEEQDSNADNEDEEAEKNQEDNQEDNETEGEYIELTAEDNQHVIIKQEHQEVIPKIYTQKSHRRPIKRIIPTPQYANKRVKILRRYDQEYKERQTKPEYPRKKDDCDSFGEYIADSLRKHDERTKSMIKHAINNIIFEQEMKKYSNHYDIPHELENPLVLGEE